MIGSFVLTFDAVLSLVPVTPESAVTGDRLVAVPAEGAGLVLTQNHAADGSSDVDGTGEDGSLHAAALVSVDALVEVLSVLVEAHAPKEPAPVRLTPVPEETFEGMGRRGRGPVVLEHPPGLEAVGRSQVVAAVLVQRRPLVLEGGVRVGREGRAHRKVKVVHHRSLFRPFDPFGRKEAEQEKYPHSDHSGTRLGMQTP